MNSQSLRRRVEIKPPPSYRPPLPVQSQQSWTKKDFESGRVPFATVVNLALKDPKGFSDLARGTNVAGNYPGLMREVIINGQIAGDFSKTLGALKDCGITPNASDLNLAANNLNTENFCSTLRHVPGGQLNTDSAHAELAMVLMSNPHLRRSVLEDQTIAVSKDRLVGYMHELSVLSNHGRPASLKNSAPRQSQVSPSPSFA